MHLWFVIDGGGVVVVVVGGGGVVVGGGGVVVGRVVVVGGGVGRVVGGGAGRVIVVGGVVGGGVVGVIVICTNYISCPKKIRKYFVESSSLIPWGVTFTIIKTITKSPFSNQHAIDKTKLSSL